MTEFLSELAERLTRLEQQHVLFRDKTVQQINVMVQRYNKETVDVLNELSRRVALLENTPVSQSIPIYGAVTGNANRAERRKKRT